MSDKGISDFIIKSKKVQHKKGTKPETSEKVIERLFVNYAKSLGCVALKLIILNGRGFPDRTVLLPGGRVLFIEFKRKGLPLSPGQKMCRLLLLKYSFEYFVCDEIGQAEQVLDDHLSTIMNK